ncbi:MAG: DUF5688 family protein [Lachnospiraceae bacterium]|nr:DUF5688 family protein [Lachnospiraceae bacterium]
MKISDMTIDDLSERLILAVINYNDSAERLLNFPHIRKGSFAVLTQLCMGDKNINGMYTTCLTVTNDMLNGWNISKEDMFDMATTNSKNLFPAISEPVVSFLSGEGVQKFLDDNFDFSKIVVLSNKSFYNGVATIFYESDALEKISKALDSNKIYIMASSVNHMYCIPENAGLNEKELQNIFKELSGAVEENEKICDSILTYDSAQKRISETEGQSYNLSLRTEQHTIQNNHR